MVEPLTIDGAQGEGGGQIVRSSLALSALTRRPVVLERIRAGRAKPGLRQQHLTAVRAVAEICGAELDGAALGSTRLRFVPGPVRSGQYRFSVSTAGSACLVFQAVLFPLLVAEGRSSVCFEGGTHNAMAPPFDFIDQSFLPVLRRMGAQLAARLERYGFYPVGGGRFVVDIAPGAGLERIELCEPGPVRSRLAHAVVARLPEHIARRELKVIRQKLGWSTAECRTTVLPDAPGPGNVIMLRIERANVTETITGFGQRGVRAEQVAQQAAAQARQYLDSGAPVGVHLADQLIIPLALAGGGALRCVALSAHTETNIAVARRFIPLEVDVHEHAPGGVEIRLRRRPAT